MNLVIEVDGREAIPVRALPWLTGWYFGAQEVAEALAGYLVEWPEVVATYRLHHGEVRRHALQFWANIHVVDLERLTDKGLDESEWRLKSTQALPNDIFVWRDEWESAYNRSPDGPDALRELAESADDFAEVQERTLSFECWVPPEVAALVVDGFSGLKPEAGQVAPVVSEHEPMKPVQRGTVQNTAIIDAIRKAGHDPLALPKNEPGKPGVKAAVRLALVGRHTAFPLAGTQFDKAWHRLRNLGEIADAV